MPRADREPAFRAASAYAPKPNGSALTYGFVATTAVALALIFFAVFYGIDLAAHPVAIALGLSVAFLLGFLFRRGRKQRHDDALAFERGRDTHDELDG